MEESRFRQQLEARNKAGKKSEKKHGEWPLLISSILWERKMFVLLKSDQLSQMILTTVVCVRASPTLPSRRRRRRKRQNMVGLVSAGTRRAILWSGTGLREATSRMVSGTGQVLGHDWFFAARDEPAGAPESPGPNLRRIPVETPGPRPSAWPTP